MCSIKDFFGSVIVNTIVINQNLRIDHKLFNHFLCIDLTTPDVEVYDLKKISATENVISGRTFHEPPRFLASININHHRMNTFAEKRICYLDFVCFSMSSNF